MKILFPFFLFCSTIASAQSDSIKLLFVGDIMQHEPQIKAAEKVRHKSYDYESCFRYVKPIIERADLAIGNLEVTLPGKPPYKGYPQFRSPDDLAKGLKVSGFDILVTANNHSNDAGRTGVINTIETLKSNGFHQTGTFKNAAERAAFYPLIVHKKNFKLAFLNYTYGTNGIKTRLPAIVNYIDTALIKEDLAVAKSRNPDFTIAIMHWGKEYKLVESKKQRQLTQWLFQNGADVVIGAHPHVIQPIKVLSDATFQSTYPLVIYSMGNFISNQTKPNTDGGIMVEMTLVKNTETATTRLLDHHYIPVWRYVQKDSKGRRKYFAVPVSAFENGNEQYLKMRSKDRAAMRAFARKMRKHLAQWDGVERTIGLETVLKK
ncbi:MAG: CapA family protein [Bacteroidota bacterium]